MSVSLFLMHVNEEFACKLLKAVLMVVEVYMNSLEFPSCADIQQTRENSFENSMPSLVCTRLANRMKCSNILLPIKRNVCAIQYPSLAIDSNYPKRSGESQLWKHHRFIKAYQEVSLLSGIQAEVGSTNMVYAFGHLTSYLFGVQAIRGSNRSCPTCPQLFIKGEFNGE
ncbi:hypothetical protein Nepgr_013924 [Nepenthes gracilis]|uniref:Uncharacterized protein n=1 Tax=Nepenthes gracilis TaxID=150966 RepID=A0AAD3SJ03_NEPGR|nr:hypothetical protein Nepgr_013924 [Nepenthes gracilis]